MSSEKASENSENLSEGKPMNATVYCEADPLRAQRLLRARFPVIDGNVKSTLQQAAEMLGWSYTRTKDVWYGEARRIDGHEFEALERIKATSLVARLSTVRAAMHETDADFFAEEARALDAVIRSLSRGALAPRIRRTD